VKNNIYPVESFLNLKQVMTTRAPERQMMLLMGFQRRIGRDFAVGPSAQRR
jgi:hypothetical protein